MGSFSYEDAVAPAAVPGAPVPAPPAPAPKGAGPVYDAQANVMRNPDGSIAATGAPTTVGPDGAINIGGSSDPAAISAWLAKHPEDPANKLTPPPAASAAPDASAGQAGPPAATPAPKTFSYEDAAAGAAASSQAPGTTTSQSLGFERELLRPLDNASIWAERGLRAIPGGAALDDGMNNLGSMVGLAPSAQAAADSHQQAITDAAAHGVVPGKIGSMVGGVLGTLPALMVPGGPIVQGAVSGALSTDNPQSLTRTATGALTGGLLGKAGDVVTNGVLNTVAPRLGTAVQALADRGVPLTTGMINGGNGFFGRLEQLGQNIPLAGELIRKRGNESLIGFNRAVGNEAIAPIGSQVVPGNSGHEMYQSAKTAIGDAYDRVGNGADVPLDGPYAAVMQNVRAGADNLPTDLKARFHRVIDREIGNRVDPTIGGLTAEGVRDAKAALNKEIAKVKNPSLFEGDYVDSLKQTRNALTSMLGRTSPEAEAQLAAADRAYPGFKAYQGAVKNSTQNRTAPNGYFTPQQLQSAINAGSSADARAAGMTPLHDLAEAGKEILPQGYKAVISPMQTLIESGVGAGVIGSDVLGGPHAGMALAAPAAILSAFYTKPAQDTLRAGLLRSAAARKSLERLIGPLEKYASAPTGLIGGVGSRGVLDALLGQNAVAQ